VFLELFWIFEISGDSGNLQDYNENARNMDVPNSLRVVNQQGV